jgi:polyhydroxybutyrate depolymerase
MLMWTTVVGLCIVLAMLSLPSLAAPAAGANRDGEIQHGGLTRTYTLHVPSSLNGSSLAPLVLVLHGGGGAGPSTERMTGFSDLADRRGFIAVYPNGVDRRWNDARGEVARQDVDDVGFLTALVEHVRRTLPIDPRRIYAAGISNGAMMSYRLACERSETFAAIGPVAGAMPEPLGPRCSPSRPVALVAINGTEDPLVRWGGGPVARNRGRTMSVPESVALWTRLNGCPSPATVTQEPDRDPADGTRVRRETREPCREGASVVLYAVEGGGHSWPGSTRSRLPLTGRLSRDINATDVIWGFFESHPKGVR